MLDADATLKLANEVEGYKVLPPCVLYGKIGQGGMGAVYRGRHLNLDIDVAIKCLKPDLTGEDEQFVVRFRREARSAARINHQNVIRVFDVSEERGLHYIVMELVQGETARQRVKRKGHLAVGEALQILHGAAAGLGEAHGKGFIHRDIKPDNVMIASNGTVKVADLGLAKPSGQSNMSMLSGTNVIMGTPQYMPPEQWENTATVTAAADVWALGATLYYMLAGGEAFGSESLPKIMQRIVLQDFPDVREKRPDVPEDVAEFIKVATQKAPENRYPDALAMVEAIDAMTTRRETLRDNEVVSGEDQNTLVSPPPAKTLAKIKFWMDSQGQIDPTGQAGEEAGDRAEQQTIVSSPSQRQPDRQPQPAAKSRAGLWTFVALLVVAAGVLGVLQPWRGGTDSPFAEVERLARAGNFAAAVSAAKSVYATNTALEPADIAGENARLASLHLGWAQQARDASNWRLCLEQLALSSALEQRAETDNLKRSALAKTAQAVDAELQRVEPGAGPVALAAMTTFRGRLLSPLVSELRVGGDAVEIAGDGMFRIDRALGGTRSVPVEVTLVTGDTVTLAPWQLSYAVAETGGNSGKSSEATRPNQTTRPNETTRPTVEPLTGGDDANTNKPSQQPKSVVLAPETPTDLAYLAQPQVVQLRGDGASPLTIRAPKDAIIRINGLAVERDGNAEAYVHQVRSDQDEPKPIQIEVSRGAQKVSGSVAVTRVPVALTVVEKVVAVGLRHSQNGWWATDKATVKLRGSLDRFATTLEVNGVAQKGVTWQGTVFTIDLPLKTGQNKLTIRALRNSWLPVTQQLRIDRISTPRITVAEDTRKVDSVKGGSYRVVVDTDAWTKSVAVVNGSELVRLQRDPNSSRFRGQVALRAGKNRLVTRATNVLGREAQLPLDITFQASVVKAEIRGVRVNVDGKQRDIRAGRQLFLPSEQPLIVDATDSTATVRINEKIITRNADGTVPLRGLLNDTKATKLEVVLENGLGRSEVFRFFAWLDRIQPAAQCLEPKSLAVGRGKPFELSGTWIDNGGLDRNGCNLGEWKVKLSPRGVAKRGTWKVTHPGLTETTTLEVVFRDRAGNSTTLPVKITVR